MTQETQLRIVPEEAQMPTAAFRAPARARHRRSFRRLLPDLLRLAVAGSAAFFVVFIYVGVPIALLAGDRLDSLLHATLLAAAAVALGASVILGVLHSTNIDLGEETP